jgi:DNA-binding GntR family transcriptional regulator
MTVVDWDRHPPDGGLLSGSSGRSGTPNLQGDTPVTTMFTSAADPRVYVQLAGRLRRQIRDGEFEPGQRMPSVTMLSQETGHARQTVAKSLQLLASEGLICRVPGLPYHVTPPSQAS